MYQFHQCYTLCYISLKLLVSSSYIWDITASPPTVETLSWHDFSYFHWHPPLWTTREERSLPSAWHHQNEEGIFGCQVSKKQMMHPLGTPHVLVFKFLLHWNREEWCYQSAFGLIAASSPGLFLAEPWEYKKVVFQQVNHLISAGKSPAAVSLWEVLSHLFNSYRWLPRYLSAVEAEKSYVTFS